MLRSDFKLGQKVYFGRKHGEQTLGKIVKLNPANARIEQLEQRGIHRLRPAGTIWTVPYNLLRLASAEVATATADVVPDPRRETLTYNPSSDENGLLEEVLICYSGLSPENLSCDGEASMTYIRQTRAALKRRLRGLAIALGREVTEAEIYAWYDSKTQYEHDHKATST